MFQKSGGLYGVGTTNSVRKSTARKSTKVELSQKQQGTPSLTASGRSILIRFELLHDIDADRKEDERQPRNYFHTPSGNGR
jgi:hypothetical protein